jgi:hypothetical protein
MSPFGFLGDSIVSNGGGKVRLKQLTEKYPRLEGVLGGLMRIIPFLIVTGGIGRGEKRKGKKIRLSG